MSYKIITLQPQLTYAPPAPQPMPLVPLGQALPAVQDDAKKKLIIAIVIILLIVVALIWLGKRQTVKRNPVKQLSTAEMAQKLYERLERRGGASKSTLQALKAYASQKS